MKTILANFLEQFPYPDEAKNVLLQEYDQLFSNAKAAELLLTHINAYKSGAAVRFDVANQDAAAAGAAAGVHEYTAQFLLYACLAEPLRLRYKEKGIDESIWHDSMMDLLYKLNECYALHGIWGTFVAFWFDGFFNMTRFALGRLQFETTTYYLTDVYSGHGITMKRDEKTVLNLHIPSGSPLRHEDVLDSYRRAYRFYNSLTINGLLPIICGSWLLYDRMKEFLPADSNIIRFQNDFEIVNNIENTGFSECWRIYNMEYPGDPALLPRDTSLRRRYADWLAAGGVSGAGYGILWFDGEKVIK